MSRLNRDDVFDAYEALPSSYHEDPRWEQVHALRAQGKHAEANGIVLQLREDYGFEG